MGDKVYDKTITKAESEQRMLLHAQTLEITIPPKSDEKDSQRMVFEAEIPEGFKLNHNE